MEGNIFWVYFLFFIYPLYTVAKWGYVYIKYGSESKPPEANLSGKLHEPPSDLKPYLVDALVNKSLNPSGRSISSTILELVRLKFIKISSKNNVDPLVNGGKEYFLELNEDKAKDITSLPKLEQRLLAFVFQGSSTCVGFSTVKSYLFSKPSITREFWKYWKDQIIFELMKSDIIDKTSYWVEKFVYTGINSRINTEYIIMFFELYVFYYLFYLNGIKPFLFFSFFIFICILLLWIFKHLIYKRSDMGNDEYSKWMAFKNWLEDFSVTKNYPIDSIVLWEKYLIYGMSLGVSERALSQLPITYDIAGNFSESVLAFLPIERYSPRYDNYELENLLRDIVHLSDDIFGKLSRTKSL